MRRSHGRNSFKQNQIPKYLLMLICIGFLWKNISAEAICFVKKLLCFDPTKRITAAETLHDPWIKKNTKKKLEKSPLILDCMDKLKNFKTYSSMQKAVLSYMAGHIISKEEESKFRDIFLMLDANGDGVLTRDELLEGFKILNNGNIEQSLTDTQNTFRYMDINKNGLIDYNGKFNNIYNIYLIIIRVLDC